MLHRSETGVTPPTISITSPSSGSQIQGTLNASVAASDGQSGIDKIELFLNRTKIGELSSAPFNFQYPLADLLPGSATLRAVGHDKDGNGTETSILATVMPSISITGIALDKQTYLPNQTAVLTVILGNSLQNAAVEATINGASHFSL